MESTPKHGHAPIRMRRVDTLQAIERVGDYVLELGERDSIILSVPDTSARGFTYSRIPIARTVNGSDPGTEAWGWNGSEDRPTLRPSVHAVGSWHGYVRAGELVEA